MGLALWGIYVSNFRKLSILALYGPRPWIIQVVLTIGLNKPIYNLHYRARPDECKNAYYDCFAVVAEVELRPPWGGKTDFPGSVSGWVASSVNTYWQECGGGCWSMGGQGMEGGGRGWGVILSSYKMDKTGQLSCVPTIWAVAQDNIYNKFSVNIALLACENNLIELRLIIVIIIYWTWLVSTSILA